MKKFYFNHPNEGLRLYKGRFFFDTRKKYIYDIKENCHRSRKKELIKIYLQNNDYKKLLYSGELPSYHLEY